MLRILLTVFFYICKNTIAEPIKKWKKDVLAFSFSQIQPKVNLDIQTYNYRYNRNANV